MKTRRVYPTCKTCGRRSHVEECSHCRKKRKCYICGGRSEVGRRWCAVCHEVFRRIHEAHYTNACLTRVAHPPGRIEELARRAALELPLFD